MIKIDLITGFLGSGKTTFIKKYAEYLLKYGYRIGILENDFGAVNVDMMLLQDLLSENCDIEMISGACDKDCHKRRFKTKLISMAMRGFDRIIIEPSGIYDTDEFFDTLCEEPVCDKYEIGNVICIADCGIDRNLSENSKYILSSQLSVSGRIVMSRCQEYDDKTVSESINFLCGLMKEYGCEDDPENRFTVKDWNRLNDEDFKVISECGYFPDNHEKRWFDMNKSFDSLYFMNLHISQDEICNKIPEMFNDRKCGNIFRVKGFMRVQGDKWIEINAVSGKISVRPINNGQDVFIVIGENLDRQQVEEYFKE